MRKGCLATVVGDKDLSLFVTENINKLGQVEKGRGRGRGASLERNKGHETPLNGRGKPSGEKGKDVKFTYGK